MTIYCNKRSAEVWWNLNAFINKSNTEMVGYSTLYYTAMGWSTTVSECVTLIKE